MGFRTKMVLLAALSLSLLTMVFQYSDIYAARFSGASGGAGHFSAGASGDRGFSGNSGIGGISSNVGLPSDQHNRIGSSGGLQLGSPPTHQLNNGCISSPALFPSANNCPSPNVINPAKAPNTAIVQPTNCNVPTSVHTNTPKNVVVHPSTVECSNHNVSHPNNAPNTTVVHPNNCNVPNSVHHTNAPSTVIVHPNNCYSTSNSNSLTVNNVQTSSSSGSSSSSGNNNDVPVANAGPNQSVQPSDKVTLDGSKSHDPNGHSLSYSWLQLAGGPVVVLSNAHTEKPTFSAPSVTSTTSLTFQLIVNNGNADSSPSVVSVTVKP
ncbi:PKD domain-containing protein [Nitrososphaera sp. AFS]|uniref:PKD domain-containing protein n=1 Tax=Nitrososphaera sp. AFS TaxID=2301191 RepID=UPI00139244F3|nr:PKD domain-containing protein [Nitrososphaera sp. AFS]